MFNIFPIFEKTYFKILFVIVCLIIIFYFEIISFVKKLMIKLGLREHEVEKDDIIDGYFHNVILDEENSKKVLSLMEKRYNYEMRREDKILSIVNNITRAYSVIIPITGLGRLSATVETDVDIFYNLFDMLILLAGFVIALIAQARLTNFKIPSSEEIFEKYISYYEKEKNKEKSYIATETWLRGIMEAEIELKINNDNRMRKINASTRCLIIGTIISAMMRIV